MPAHKEAPLFAGRIHGIRSWTLRWEDGDAYLGALSAGGRWGVGGVTEAKCTAAGRPRPGGHAAPARSCSCGLHAVHPHVPGEGWVRATFDDEEVIGVVEAWGRTEVHVDGIRAQYARPVAICLGTARRDSDRGHLLARLADRHNAELLEIRDRAGLAAECRRR